MYRSGERLVVSASDLVGHLCCEHLSVLSLEAADGERRKPREADPELAVLTRRGLEHEAAYLNRLRSEGRSVFCIDRAGLRTSLARAGTSARDLAGPSAPELAAMASATLEVLRGGADAVYQATFYDTSGTGPVWRGHADFLTRVERPGRFGDFSYEPEDTKLAHHVKPSAILQLCDYAEQLTQLQGVPPENVHVVLGGQERRSFPVTDFCAYYRAAKARFLASLGSPVPTYPNPVEHCGICSWRTICEARRETDDQLWLVARMSRSQAGKLAERTGITTMAALAAHDGSAVPGMSGATLERLGRQARLQVARREAPDEPPPYELLAPDGPGRGLAALPDPSQGDLFFDIEGDPFAGDGGIEYLLGLGWMEGTNFVHRIFWGHDPAGEKAAFEAFIDFVDQRRRQCPDMHIYHYAPYERAALGKLMGRHATREEEVDALLRGEVLVDLYRVVRQGLCVGTASYSLKKLEPLYMQPRTGEITDAGSSIVEYERWLETGADEILEAIGEYNRVDCDSTRRLRDWLEERRTELGPGVERPGWPENLPSEAVAGEVTEVTELAARLTSGMQGRPGDGAAGANTEQTARWLLAQLLDWHRREEKPEWWSFFSRVRDLGEQELLADTEAIAGLVYEGVEAQEKRSLVHRYRFDPAQEHKLPVGQAVRDPASERQNLITGTKLASPGTLVGVDGTHGLLRLKRGRTSAAPHPRALIPGGPFDTGTQREALRRLARSVLAHGIDGGGPYRAVRDLLLGLAPRLAGVEPGQSLRHAGEDGAAAAVRLALALDGGTLAIQGPPGSGKTYGAAQLLVALVGTGQRVGITANSHSVIANLLARVMACAREQGVKVRALQKAAYSQRCTDPDVEWAPRSEDVEYALAGREVDLVAGTAWLFTRPGMDQALDVLVVDEAGQLSLANAAAVGTAARNLVLVGDPRQLAQPSKGTHPRGTGVSGLDHLLAGKATIAADRGLFLDVTRRLHPGICAFVSEVVYDGRLHSVAGCERQTVADGPLVGGSGLRWVPVRHTGNRTSSTEEAAAVAERYAALLGRSWTDRHGQVAALGPTDILVVAPYNAQVALLVEHLPAGAKVGTVDKFQGQEAAVVLVSLTASSAEDVPRGMEFLYSTNRLNVAISRARALALVVGSPRLLAVHCRSVEQLRLANGLCRLVELAG